MQAAAPIDRATQTAERAVLVTLTEPEAAAGSRAAVRSSRQALEPEVVADTLPTSTYPLRLPLSAAPMVSLRHRRHLQPERVPQPEQMERI